MEMKNNLVVNVKKDELLEENNLQTASALLALLHGKSDSICRIFNKEIMVGKSDLKTLNDMMIEKLSLNNVLTIKPYAFCNNRLKNVIFDKENILLGCIK